MRDAETVASITAGDRDALATAYDRYAPGLYAYCHSLLGEPAAVSDAVRDTFIVAAAELSGLDDPGTAPALAVCGGPQRVPLPAAYACAARRAR